MSTVIINLERLSGDGYKMNANSPLEDTPSYITHAQLRYMPFTSSEAIQGTFVTGALSTVEFSVTGANLTRLLKLYVSTDGTTYTERKSWGGTDGIRVSTGSPNLVYFASLSQTGTSDPAISSTEINLLSGTPTATFDSTGTYRLTLTNGFSGNTYVELFFNQGNSNGRELTGYKANSNSVLIESRVAGTLTNTVGSFVVKIWQF